VPPRVAITVGDPRGIGPEIVEKILQDPPPGADLVVLGPDEIVAGYPVATIGVGTMEGGGSELENAGRLTASAVEQAAQLALAGEVQAIVTGPAEKRALHAAGYPYPGHTEWLAELSGAADVAMMLTADNLRVVLVTTHIPLRQVLQDLTVDRVVSAGRVTQRVLEDWFRIPQPRLAVCAVNPHAGEGGLFGDEDHTILRPAAELLGATGPLPADTVFLKASRGEFDAVLAPYHDVGMTAIKMASFGRAVNVTLGLPFIRTAPDHGTGFDIAGKGIADPGSMRRALELAIELATRTTRPSAGRP
jgi:4-hydroxythreonine-4-phosphate dehydrogenase